MSQYIYDIALRVIAIVFGTIAIVVAALKNSKNEKIREAATRTAEVVETIYRGCSSNEKLTAFKKLCEEQKVNVKKAVKFLEKYIIPSSKNINVCNPPHGDKEIDEDTVGLA